MKNIRPFLFLSFCLILTGCDGTNYKKLYSEYIAKYPDYTGDKKTFVDDYKNNRLDLDIKFETFKGSKVETQKAHKGEKITITQKSTLTNYSFAGWYKTESLEEEIQYSFVADASVTFYAKFDPQCFSTFYVGDEVYQHLVIEDDGKVKKPDDPTKVGFQFDCWLDEEGEEYNFDTIVTGKSVKLYAKFSYDFLELPAIIINTDDGEDIVSREEYKDSKVSVLNTQNSYLMNEIAAGVRGRGNSSWNWYPKKPYRIKFNKKQAMFGSSYKAKSWTLIANYQDKSLMRNYLAYELSKQIQPSRFTSVHIPVELYLNGDYKGVYLLCDQMQVGDGRVEIDESIADDGNNGYFFEVDSRAGDGDVYFEFKGQKIVIKSPDTEDAEFINKKDIEINYLSSYLEECSDALDDEPWSRVDELIDVNSFVDAYLIDELFMNVDAGHTSAFYYKDIDGKLTKGPVWDFDMAAGNVNYGPGDVDECPADSTLFVRENHFWYQKLLNRTEFVNLFKTKLSAVQTNINNLLELIDKDNQDNVYFQNKESFNRNFDRWPTMGEYVQPEPKSVYELASVLDQMEYVRRWLSTRYNYLVATYIG